MVFMRRELNNLRERRLVKAMSDYPEERDWVIVGALLFLAGVVFTVFMERYFPGFSRVLFGVKP